MNTLSKDELIFCVNCIKDYHKYEFVDTPEKVKQLIEDIYEVKVKLEDIQDVFDVPIIDEEESMLLYSELGYD